MRVSYRHAVVLFYALALLCPPAFAGGDTPGAPCDFRKLAPWQEESHRFKEERLYSGQPYLHHVDNKRFVDNSYSIFDEDRTLTFHTENAVMKILSEKGFLDKEITAGALNAYKTIFFNRLMDSPVLDHLIGIEQGGRYNEAKSVRLIFDTKPGVLESSLIVELDNLRTLVAAEFATTMRDYNELSKGYIDHPNPMVRDPFLWNEVGMGSRPGKASWQARIRRQSVLNGHEPHDLYFGPRSQETVARHIERAEGLRRKLDAKLGETPLFAQGLPVHGLVEILRSAETAEHVKNLEDYQSYIRDRVFNRFGYRFESDKDIDRLQRYFHIANELAPPILTPYQESMQLADLSRADHGVWGFDVTGQNARNITGVFASLYMAAQNQKPGQHDYDLVNRALELTEEEQARQSQKFWGFQGHLEGVLNERGLIVLSERHRFEGTGDDFTAKQRITVTPRNRAIVLQKLANNPERGSLFRSTLQSQNYESGRAIERENRLTWISEAEKMEKNLRVKLEGSVERGLMPYEDLRECVVSFVLTPISKDQVRVEVDVAGRKGAIDRSRVADLAGQVEATLRRENLVPRNWILGSVKTVDQILDETSVLNPPVALR